MSRQEGRAPHRPCRHNSQAFALLCLALAVRAIGRAGTSEASFDQLHQFASRPDRWQQRRVEDAFVPNETLSGENCSLMVLVLSARENFASRQRIRTSWKHQGSSCIHFMVGDDFCEVPWSMRKEWTCEERDESEPDMAAQKHHDSVQSEVQACLQHEAEENGDVVFLPLKDYYKNLPRKLKESYLWALQSSSATWFLKVDDDVFVDVGRLQDYLCSLDQQHLTVLGRVWNQSKVRRSGKWAEYKYREREMDARYPPFPVGSFGYVVSRDLATEVVDMDGTEYQGEDVSLGIWLDESPMADHLIWISEAGFANDAPVWFGKQKLVRDPDADVMVLSHSKQGNRLQDELYWCPGAHKLMTHDTKEDKASGNDMSSQELTVHHMDPLRLDIGNRFDIVVKAIYAIFRHRAEDGHVPEFVASMYNRHLEVWNNFKEPCTFRGEADWFDATKPCIMKSTAKDFQNSFSTIIESIAQNGFDTKQSLVPVTTAGFPLNGAHRVATAIALGLPTMPVQQVMSTNHYKWGHAFFASKGYQDIYADFAMLQWTLHVDATSTVLFWPEAASDQAKMASARIMVKELCGEVLYEKTIFVNRKGLGNLCLHAYGEQEWLLAKVHQLQSSCDWKEAMRPVSVFFVLPKSSEALRLCKHTLRSHFALSNFKSSVHIPDHHEEAVLVAEMTLNSNSVLFLNRHDGTSCHEVACELATRMRMSAVNPASYVLPQTIMVDSGAVMSFFGLRKLTDVDLLFQGDLDESLLGAERGIFVDAHSFEYNRRVPTERAWGAEHLSNCSARDLFSDPKYYGYCHGLKYISLQQLVRYKQLRAEPNKDREDVRSIKMFFFRLASAAEQIGKPKSSAATSLSAGAPNELTSQLSGPPQGVLNLIVHGTGDLQVG